jgi:ATP-binding protein involved in chromosome partitioning
MERERIAGVSRTVVVASGKGGVGKTTVAVNLALALAAAGHRAGVFDADVYGPNVPLLLGVHREQSTRGTVPVARASKEPYIQPLDRYGLKVMSFGLILGERDAFRGGSHHTGMLARQTLLDVVWGTLDYLVLDFPPGSGEPLDTLLRQLHVDGAVVVTTPQDLSLLDAGRSLDLFRKANVPVIGMVENMSYVACPHCGEQIEVFHRSEREWAVEDQAVPLLGRVPLDVAISRRITPEHPLVLAQQGSSVADGTAAEVFRDVATKVAARLPAG